MKKFILPIILLLATVFFLSPKVDAQTNPECRKIYDKEDYKCFGVFNECSDSCVKEAEKPDGTLYFNSGELYPKCIKANRCHEKSDECHTQAQENYYACLGGISKDKEATDKKTGAPEANRPFLENIVLTVREWFGTEPSFLKEPPQDTDIEASVEITAGQEAKPVVIQPIIKQEFSDFFFSSVEGDGYLLLPDGTKVIPKSQEIIQIPLNTKFVVPDGARMLVGYALDAETNTTRTAHGVMSLTPGSQVALKEFHKGLMADGRESRIGTVLEVQEGVVRFKGRGVSKKLPAASPGGVMLGTKGTDYAVSFDKKNSLTTTEIYDGEIEVTDSNTRQAKTISAVYGEKIRQLKVSKDGIFTEKIAVPQKQFYKEKILASIVLIGVILLPLGTIWFVKRKKKK